MPMHNACRVISLILALVSLAALTGCSRQSVKQEQALALGGDADRGREALLRNGCGSCHAIPGVMEIESLTAPSLADIGKRWYIAGILPNTPANMVLWIRNPQSVDPETAKPAQELPDEEIRDMVAYLYSAPR
jgi:cytochrome c